MYYIFALKDKTQHFTNSVSNKMLSIDGISVFCDVIAICKSDKFFVFWGMLAIQCSKE